MLKIFIYYYHVMFLLIFYYLKPYINDIKKYSKFKSTIYIKDIFIKEYIKNEIHSQIKRILIEINTKKIYLTNINLSNKSTNRIKLYQRNKAFNQFCLIYFDKFNLKKFTNGLYNLKFPIKKIFIYKKLNTYIKYTRKKYKQYINNKVKYKNKKGFYCFLSISIRNNQIDKFLKSKSKKIYLRKFEELYKKYEEDDLDDEKEIDKKNIDYMNLTSILKEYYKSNNIIKDLYEYNNENINNIGKTLSYEFISNKHNLEFENIKSVDQFIKNNEILEKEKYQKLRKTYLVYTYKFKYKNPFNEKKIYTYEYCIPKLKIDEKEDISTESKYITSDFKSIKLYKNSPINSLTISGFTNRNIDTFGSERNKIYSFNTITDIKRNIFFNDLILISSSYNQHFFSNINFLLNLHTLQILIRDKTAIETDYITNKFDKLCEKLNELNKNNLEKKSLIENDKTSNLIKDNFNNNIKQNNIQTLNNENNEILINSDKNNTNREEILEDKINNQNNKIDQQLLKYINYENISLDKKITYFKPYYEGNILEDIDFINLWKYNKNGLIINNINTIPIPKIYLNIDDPKYSAWKIFQISGLNAFKEIPTPNRKLEAWRQQNNLKDFYRINFDTSISLRYISKNELDKYKMKILDNSYKDVNKYDNSKYEKNENINDENNLYDIEKNDIKDKKQNINLINTNKSELNILESIKREKEKHKKAFYTLVIRDGVIDEYLSDDINILKNYNEQLIQMENKQENIREENKQKSDEYSEKKCNFFIGSYFNIKNAELEQIINKEMYFIPEYTNWYKKNTQPFIRGQIGKQSRKFDNDYPIYDYRKSDFGMAKFSALNLASIKDTAVIYLNENINFSDKFIHVIFISTSKNEDNEYNENNEMNVDIKESIYNINNENNNKNNIENNNENNNKNNIENNNENNIENNNKNNNENNNKNNNENNIEYKNYNIYRPITNPRLMIYIKKNSKLNIYESHISLNKKNSGLVNAYTRVYLEDNAKVNHNLSQELADDVWYFHNISVKNNKNSEYKFVDILLGSLSTRVNLQIEGEENSKQESYGVGILNKKQNFSQYQMFHHEYPNMTTEQLIKYLVSDNAQSIYRSRGRIEKNAIKTKLNTLCKSFLYNLGASSISIPTLEIIPSNIEYANHGSTISDIEKEPVFILMTRGIDKNKAKELVVKSYLDEILIHMFDDGIKERVIKKIADIVRKHKKTETENIYKK